MGDPHVALAEQGDNIKAPDSLTMKNKKYKVEFGKTPSKIYFCFAAMEKVGCGRAIVHAGVLLAGNDYKLTSYEANKSKSRNYMAVYRVYSQLQLEICESLMMHYL